MKDDRLYILFGEEHYNPLGLLRSLGEAGIKPVAIIKKGEFAFASKSKYISKLHLVDSNEEGYELLLEEYGNEEKKPFLFTCDDQLTSYLDMHYDELKDKFIFYNAGKQGRITEYMNKENMFDLAEKCGINIAKTWTVKKGEIPKDIEYPVVTKTLDSTMDHWKWDSFVCENEESLKKAIKKIRSKKIIIQQFIDKKDEICFDGYSVAKGKKVLYAILSNYPYIVDNAYSCYMVVQNSNKKEVEKKITKMLSKIGFEGIFSVEFLVDKNDKLYFLEINFRNSTWSYASTKAGMNLPILWSSAMLDNSVFDKSLVKFDKFTAMAEFVDYKQRVRTKQISKLKWFRQLFGCKCLYYINIKDMKPMYSKILHKITKKNQYK